MKHHTLHPRLAGLLAALFATPLCGQKAIGEPAVDITFDAVRNAPGPLPGSSELFGSVVLVVYWASWVKPCTEHVGKLNNWHSKYAPQGLAVVGVSHDELSDIDDWIKKNKPAYLIAQEKGDDSQEAFGAEGYPIAVLIDSDGKVAWKGNPGTLTEETVTGLLPPARPAFARLEGALTPVQQLLDQNQTAKAAVQLEVLIAGGKLDETALRTAQIRKTRFERLAAAGIAKAAWFLERNRDYEAIVELHMVAVRFAGSSLAIAPNDKLKEIGAKSGPLRREVDAAIFVARAMLHEQNQDYEAAYTEYKRAAGKNDTEAKKQAQGNMARIDHKGMRGFKTDCADCVSGGRACKKHARK